MRALFLAAGLALAAGSSWAQSATPLAQVPFAGYGEAHVWPDCISRVAGGAAWSAECRLSGKLMGDDFSVPLDHVFRLGNEPSGLTLRLGGPPRTSACAPREWSF